jgi:hypothetical protein
MKLPLEPVRLADGRYFNGPVTPRLLGLLVTDGLAELLETFDVLAEFEHWLEGEPVVEWPREKRVRYVLWVWNPDPAAWGKAGGLPRMVDEDDRLRPEQVRRELRELRGLWTRAMTTEPRRMIERLTSDPMRPLQARLDLVPVGKGRRVAIRPVSIIDRSLFELFALLRQELRPVECGHCGMIFPPARAGQRFCPGTDCRDRSFRVAHDRTSYRREYQRMYARWRRGRLSVDEMAEWRREYPDKATYDRKKAQEGRP